MVFADQSFHIHRVPTRLLPVHVPDQWLLARHIFLAHSASLRRVIFSKTLKSRRRLLLVWSRQPQRRSANTLCHPKGVSAQQSCPPYSTNEIPARLRLGVGAQVFERVQVGWVGEASRHRRVSLTLAPAPTTVRRFDTYAVRRQADFIARGAWNAASDLHSSLIQSLAVSISRT